MNIEFTIEKNIEAISDLNKTVHNKHYESHPNLFNKYDKKEFKRWFEKYLSKDNIFSILVKKDGIYIGYAIVEHRKVLKNNPFSNPNSESLYVDQMSIEEEFQNKGIGYKLVNFIKIFAQLKGINRIQLDVWSDNLQAKHFYKKNEFKPIREIMEYKIK